MSSAEEIAKFKAEGENATADIGDIGYEFGTVAVSQGVTQAYKPTTWEEIPEWAKDKDGHWVIGYTGTIAFIVNKELVKDIPTSWKELGESNAKVTVGAVGIASQATNSVLAAAFALGAAGVQMGTCLLASTECPIHDNYKQAILKAKDNDTIVTGRIAGTPVRVLKNEMSREYVKQEKAGADKMELEKYTLGSLRKAVFDGDTMNGSLMAGQVAGQIDKIQPIEKIFEQIYEEYEAVRKELYAD